MAVPIPNFGGPGDIIVDVNSINTPSGTIYVTPGILSDGFSGKHACWKAGAEVALAY